MMLKCDFLCVSFCCFLCISFVKTCIVEQHVCGKVGQDIQLNCSLEKENSSITWQKDSNDIAFNEEIQNGSGENRDMNENYKIDNTNRHYNLIIKNSSFNDAGNYSCITTLNITNIVKDCKYVIIEDDNTYVKNNLRTKKCKANQNTDEKIKDFKFRNILLYIGICGCISLLALTASFCLCLMKRFQLTCERKNSLEAAEIDGAQHYTEVEVDEIEVQL